MGSIDQKALLSSAKKISTDRVLQVKHVVILYTLFKILSLAVIIHFAILEFLRTFQTQSFLKTILELLLSRSIPSSEVQFIIYLLSTVISMAMFYYILLSLVVTIEGHPERVINFIRHSAISIRNYIEFQGDETIRTYTNNILSEVGSYSSIKKPIALFGFLSIFGYALQISSVNFFVISLGLLLEALTIMIIQSYGISRIVDISNLVNKAYKEFMKISNYFEVYKIPYSQVTSPKERTYRIYHIIILIIISPVIFLEIAFFVFVLLHFMKFILSLSQYIYEEWIFEDHVIDLVTTILEKY